MGDQQTGNPADSITLLRASPRIGEGIGLEICDSPDDIIRAVSGQLLPPRRGR